MAVSVLIVKKQSGGCILAWKLNEILLLKYTYLADDLFCAVSAQSDSRKQLFQISAAGDISIEILGYY
jgi:hypothetical protein